MAKPSLTLKRRFAAPAEKVYAAWTQPAQLMRWFGPDRGPVHDAQTDVRVGGRFSVSFSTEDGERHNVSGEYREVVPNERLAFTWQWITMPERQSYVIVTIKPDGDGCILTLHHEQFFDEAARDGHKAGWTGTLEKLARVVE
ncbi:MAG TPA: SRPBCC domain-containing protein [Pseudolabrys sp.]|nr:SRPBCC domain-containing protein [Pseudolabrys sp.]